MLRVGSSLYSTLTLAAWQAGVLSQMPVRLRVGTPQTEHGTGIRGTLSSPRRCIFVVSLPGISTGRCAFANAVFTCCRLVADDAGPGRPPGIESSGRRGPLIEFVRGEQSVRHDAASAR